MSDASSDQSRRRGRLAEIETCLDTLSEEILRRFGTTCRFHHFHILAHDDVSLHVYVVFRKDRELHRYKRNANGMQQRVVDFMYAELGHQGIASRNEITVEFELDSDEAAKARHHKALRNIPTAEDFARADRLDRERTRNLDKVSENVSDHFRRTWPLYRFFMFNEGDVKFRACVFFEKEEHVQAYRSKGSLRDTPEEVSFFFKGEPRVVRASQVGGDLQEIIDFVYAELERQGRGKRGDIAVAFEFDSDENVNANFEGDYFLRLR